jgi:hypothetical protein
LRPGLLLVTNEGTHLSSETLKRGDATTSSKRPAIPDPTASKAWIGPDFHLDLRALGD